MPWQPSAMLSAYRWQKASPRTCLVTAIDRTCMRFAIRAKFSKDAQDGLVKLSLAAVCSFARLPAHRVG